MTAIGSRFLVYPRSPGARDLHTTDKDPSVGAPDLGHPAERARGSQACSAQDDSAWVGFCYLPPLRQRAPQGWGNGRLMMDRRKRQQQILRSAYPLARGTRDG